MALDDARQLLRPQTEWDILLDLDELAAGENEDWIWQGAFTLPPEHELAIVKLSRGGGDAVVLREIDLATKAFAPGGLSFRSEGSGWMAGPGYMARFERAW